MVALKYIDKSAAAVLVLKDYFYMESIIAVTPESIKEAYAHIYCPTKSEINIYSTSNDIFNKELLEARYLTAIDYMNWFLPCWNKLSKSYKRILSELYMGEKQRSGALVRLQSELNYSERQIGRLRKKAIEDLAFLLYGK